MMGSMEQDGQNAYLTLNYMNKEHNNFTQIIDFLSVTLR